MVNFLSNPIVSSFDLSEQVKLSFKSKGYDRLTSLIDDINNNNDFKDRLLPLFVARMIVDIHNFSFSDKELIRYSRLFRSFESLGVPVTEMVFCCKLNPLNPDSLDIYMRALDLKDNNMQLELLKECAFFDVEDSILLSALLNKPMKELVGWLNKYDETGVLFGRVLELSNNNASIIGLANNRLRGKALGEGLGL